MRIALVTDYYLPTLGGVQTVVKAHREALTQAGDEVVVFTPLSAPSDDPDVVRLPTARSFAPDGYPFTWTLAAAARVLQEEFAGRGIEVVHVHTEMFAALAAFRAADALGLPVVQTMHGRIDVYTRSVLPVPALTVPLLAQLHRRGLGGHDTLRPDTATDHTRTRSARQMWRLMVSQANRAAQVIVPSGHFAAKLVAQGVTTPITVLSNGLEGSVLDAIGAPTKRRLEREEELRVMWCGRVSPEKRPEVMVTAAGLVPGLRVDMYGDGVSRRRLRRRAAELPESRVRVHGAVSQAEVLSAMRDAHVLVSTSWDFDNQPMVLLEAVASGLPVLVADPDLAEGLPAEGHLVAATPDAVGIADALRALREDPALIERMSLAAGAHHEQVRQDTHLPALRAIYRGAMAERRV